MTSRPIKQLNSFLHTHELSYQRSNLAFTLENKESLFFLQPIKQLDFALVVEEKKSLLFSHNKSLLFSRGNSCYGLEYVMKIRFNHQ